MSATLINQFPVQIGQATGGIATLASVRRGLTEARRLGDGSPDWGVFPCCRACRTNTYGDIVIARETFNKDSFARHHPSPWRRFPVLPPSSNALCWVIDNARQLGADGVVFDLSYRFGRRAHSLMRQLIRSITEACPLRSIVLSTYAAIRRKRWINRELGCNRILTSGAQATAEQGILLLKIAAAG